VSDEPIQTQSTADAEEAARATADAVQPGDTVLVKASRGMHLETVVEELLRR
jgi:UDP-N-acetylmuramyl pentapeptide synthase